MTDIEKEKSVEKGETEASGLSLLFAKSASG